MDTMTDGKPCRSCMDFKSWAKLQKKAFNDDKKSEKSKADADSKNEPTTTSNTRKDCPLDKDSLGSQTWAFLHTMAANYPTEPTKEQKKEMKTFFRLLAEFYPCHICAADLQVHLKESPPQTDSQHQLSQWLCKIHNDINRKLDKPIFDCKLVDQRWRDGWLDGSCD